MGGRSVGVPGTPALMAPRMTAGAGRSGPGSSTMRDPAGRGGLPGQPATGQARGARCRAAGAVRCDTRLFPARWRAARSEGDTLRNPAYAETLRLWPRRGRRPSIPASSPRTSRDRAGRRGQPRHAARRDLAIYEVRERPAVCVPYRGYEVCGMGPPSSGGVTVGQILGLLRPFDLAALGPDSAEAWRLIGDASRLAFADRGRYLADSDFVPGAGEGPARCRLPARPRELLRGDDALPEVSPGAPEFDHALDWGRGETLAQPATSHISIVDSHGNALSMTTTIENAFGSRLMVRGFLLNNELTDFSFASHATAAPSPTRWRRASGRARRWRPRSCAATARRCWCSAAPGAARSSASWPRRSSPGPTGAWTCRTAVALPHLVNRFGPYDIEPSAARLAPALVDGL